MTAKKDPQKGYVALLGWSLNAIEALEKFDRRFVVVAPDWARAFAEEHDIPFMSWDFERLNDRSMEIAEKLQAEGVDVAIPLFEETVEWSGAINSVLMDNPRLYGQSVLFRDKALMKRRAQLGGIRVGIFEEAHDREDVIRFLKRVNQTLLKLDGDPNDPIHLKAFDKAGCLGHRVIRTPDEVDTIPDEEFPVLMESHLDGWEFAVEAWIHDGKIRFLNISEYVTLGYSVFVPATPDLESWRPRIEQEIEKLIKTFDLKSGFIHPEYFVTSDGTMYFGEVAYRPPGFKVFELLEKVYGFNAYQAMVLVFDPKTTEQEIVDFFP
ncbi:MAG TPA: carboxylate--amine ligase, partial [Alcanivorax sp.]|nr:carboxylate--amine ligase [Alcanivorax sp.]